MYGLLCDAFGCMPCFGHAHMRWLLHGILF